MIGHICLCAALATSFGGCKRQPLHVGLLKPLGGFTDLLVAGVWSESGAGLVGESALSGGTCRRCRSCAIRLARPPGVRGDPRTHGPLCWGQFLGHGRWIPFGNPAAFVTGGVVALRLEACQMLFSNIALRSFGPEDGLASAPPTDRLFDLRSTGTVLQPVMRARDGGLPLGFQVADALCLVECRHVLRSQLCLSSVAATRCSG